MNCLNRLSAILDDDILLNSKIELAEANATWVPSKSMFKTRTVMMKDLFSINGILIIIGMLYLFASIASILNNSQFFQWDFRTYYYAAKAFQANLDPYDLEVLSRLADQPITLGFVYPPHVLLFLKPLTRLDYLSAYHVFISLKVITFGALFYIWNRLILNQHWSGVFLLFTLFGFGGTLYIDFISGNISIFEQFLLWLAFYLLLKQRSLLAGSLIAFASLSKIFPILFLPIILFSRDKHRVRNFFLTGTLFVFIFLLTAILWPELTSNFLQKANNLGGRGLHNPSTLALFEDLHELAISKGISVPRYLPNGLYILSTIVVLSTSAFVYHHGQNIEIKHTIFFATFVFAICVPRFKDYSYILLILPAYYFISNVELIRGSWLLVLFSLSRNFYIPFDYSNSFTNYFWDYYPLLCLFVLWGVIVCHIWNHKNIDLGPLDKIQLT